MKYVVGLVIVLLLSVVAIALMRYVRISRDVAAVVSRIEALNGAVGDSVHPFYGPAELHFSVEGLEPLVTDNDLVELAPSLRKMRVRYVGLTNTRISDRGLDALLDALCDSVQVIELSGTSVSDRALKALSLCPNLKQLSIPVALLTSDGISHVAGITALKTIIIFGANADDERVRSLRRKVGDNVAVQPNHNAHFHAQSP